MGLRDKRYTPTDTITVVGVRTSGPVSAFLKDLKAKIAMGERKPSLTEHRSKLTRIPVENSWDKNSVLNGL